MVQRHFHERKPVSASRMALQSDYTKDIDWRPMTVRERVLKFPGSVKTLYKDWQLYQCIRDAATTPRNAWTMNDHRLSAPPETDPFGTSNRRRPDTTHSCIPWRQREQQRRFWHDITTVLPVVVVWLLPIVGYIPMFVSIAAPRQLLSRHFHNDYETYHYNQLAYQQRHAHFRNVQELFWDSFSVPAREAAHEWANEQNSTATDSAGPVLVDHLLPLYRAVLGDAGSSSSPSSSPTASVNLFPRNYLVHFALAVGVYQTLPPKLSDWLATWTPSWWLRRKVRQLAVTVAHVDHALVVVVSPEGTKAGELTTRNENDVVAILTDVELMDACLMRGLPVVDVTTDEMHVCLRNHVRMISNLELQIVHASMPQPPKGRETMTVPPTRNNQPRSIDAEAFGLFTLHLPIIRDYFKR